ncbi:MAG: hypothetical protein D6813_00600, partial [Calditrichaeota bacterium]
MKNLNALLAFIVITIFITGVLLYGKDMSRQGKGRINSLDFGSISANGQPRSTLLNINSLAVWLRADGFSSRDPRTGNSGVFFPRGLGTNAAVIFTDGILWGGLVQDGQTPTLRVGGQTFNIGTIEGRIVSPGVAEDPNAPDVRIYRIRPDYATADLNLDAQELGLPVEQVREQYGIDWAEWPWEKGAPWKGINNE